MCVSAIVSSRPNISHLRPAAARSFARASSRALPVSVGLAAPAAAISLSSVAGSSRHGFVASSNSLNPRKPNSSRNCSRVRAPFATSASAWVASCMWMPPRPVTAAASRPGA
jgi:hypothetical protein